MIDPRDPWTVRRRLTLRWAAALALLLGLPRRIRAQASGASSEADRRWMDAAFAMRRLAESWGDQPYGAVLIVNGAMAGEGPSRVVQRGDPDAHAEREAIADAQRRLGRKDLGGAVLYSTSRPCSRCEQAAAEAGVARMVHGPELRDAGAPLRR
ncbi:MAG: deaminase [Burkholderiales bacterium]|jgi:tRNA(adenine34) deaminase|nr:deaminase [Burkholderiales bacterium]